MTDYEDPEAIFDVVPQVLPEGSMHDGSNGAAGCEIRDAIYEPYPHEWDLDLTWCRIRYAAYTKNWSEFQSQDRPPEKIPGWVYKRALPYVRRDPALRRY